jgi:hypothetical protein
VNYLDPQRVTKYIALEPNTLMHPRIRKVANAAGYSESDDTFLILSCGAEDLTTILHHLPRQSVDTVISVLTLCSLPESPSPQSILAGLVDAVLKSGGQLLFYEHVLSPLADVAWWQRLWTPLWKRIFDGCRLDRPTHIWVHEMKGWREEKVWGKDGEPDEHLFWHRAGRYVKN